MRCGKARRILGLELEDQGVVSGNDELRAHLESCTACAEFANQLGRTWEMLGAVPEIPLPAGFNEKLLARVRAEEIRARPSWSFGRMPAWQWMTLAASVLLLAVILAPGTINRDPARAGAVTDQWDDSFLESLDSSLEHPDYLPVYDRWAEEAAESPAETPAVQDNPGGVRHGKS